MTEVKNPAKESKPAAPLTFGQNIFAGALAGGTELVCMYPLDVVKTRFQLAVSQPGVRASIIGSLRDVIREEGFMSLYRGILPPLAVEPLKRAIKFSANATYTKMLVGEGGKHSLLTASIGGFMAGSTEAVVIAAPEVIKIRMQSKERRSVYRNSFDAGMKMLKAEGPMVFAQGLAAAVVRNGIWNGSYFGTIHFIKSSVWKDEPEDKGAKMMRSFLCGVGGGFVGTTLNTPFDTVASRMRNVLPGEEVRYTNPFQAVVRIGREEGTRALWKGYVPKLLRLGPGGGILLVVFDLVSNYIRQKN